VVHFLGHGEAPSPTAPARLLFYNEMHQPEPVDITYIWRMLRRIDALRLIWLNSCSGAVGKEGMLYGPLASAAARFVAAGVPAVIANQLRISDQVAQKLALTFYTFLAEGQPIDVALAEARFRVGVSATARNSLEWATPILYMRAPDGVLFTRSEATSAAAPATNAPPTSAPQPATSSPSSNDEEQQFISEQIRTLRRRLNQRQLQAAKYGIGVDPAISIEIEDLQKEIAQWESKLTRR
jgi:CHAT domain-containing protein